MKFVLTEGHDRTGSRGPVPGKVAAFYGIRYAALTSGRRFSAPVPVRADEQLDAAALTDVPIFPSRGSGLEAVLGRADAINPQSEDAFFLNVWAPDGADRLPVVLFLHGGAWTSGGGSLQWYDGRHLAAGGLVVVTVNYRLGPFAHLAAPRENGGQAPNRPVQDLVTALTFTGSAETRVGQIGRTISRWMVRASSEHAARSPRPGKNSPMEHGHPRPWPTAVQARLHAVADQILTPHKHETGPVP